MDASKKKGGNAINAVNCSVIHLDSIEKLSLQQLIKVNNMFNCVITHAYCICKCIMTVDFWKQDAR